MIPFLLIGIHWVESKSNRFAVPQGSYELLSCYRSSRIRSS